MATRYLITLTDPAKEAFWEELLSYLKFVEVQKIEKARKLKLTKKEKKFMKGLRESVQEIKDDLSGKKKLPSARSVIKKLKRS